MRGQKALATFIENSFMLYEPSWIFVTVDEFHNTSKEEWFRLQAPSSKSRAATTGKAPKAWALPRFWVSICSFKKQPTVVHVTIRVGTLSIWRGVSHMWYMSRDFLGFIHNVLKGNIVVWLKLLIFHPKNTKLGKSGDFKSL